MGLFFYNKIGSIIPMVVLPTTEIIEPDFSWLLFNVSLFHYRGLEKESPVLGMLGFLQQSGYCLK